LINVLPAPGIAVERVGCRRKEKQIPEAVIAAWKAVEKLLFKEGIFAAAFFFSRSLKISFTISRSAIDLLGVRVPSISNTMSDFLERDFIH
jgi:hypothetical protein